jgi:hypothetical protein
MSERQLLDSEADAAAFRLGVLWSKCPSAEDGPHTWNLDTGKCQWCGAAFPYADGASQ